MIDPRQRERLKRLELTAEVREARRRRQAWNRQGHPRDCVCRVCFEAWRRAMRPGSRVTA